MRCTSLCTHHYGYLGFRWFCLDILLVKGWPFKQSHCSHVQHESQGYQISGKNTCIPIKQSSHCAGRP